VTRLALAGISAFAIVYLLAGTLQLPVLVYDPVARVATVSRPVTGVSMRYFGDLLVAAAAGLVTTAIARRTRPRTSLATAAATALSLVGLDVAYYLSRLLAAT
jgi:hypothetical protein